MSEKKPKSNRYRYLWFVAALLVCIGGGIAILRVPWRLVLLSKEDVLKLIELKNVGNASLENIPNVAEEDGAESVAAFTTLKEKLPDEPLGYRNLLIAQILRLGKLNPGDKRAPAILQAADRALDQLRQLEGNTGVVHLLSANLLRRASEHGTSADKQQVKEYLLALEKLPDDGVIWSELYNFARDNPDEEVSAVASDALRRAYQKNPGIST